MKAKAPRRKWRLEAHPHGQPHYRREGRRHVSTALFRREYPREQSAYRAAAQVHRRYPDADLSVITFTFDGFFWISGSGDTARLHWCPACGGRLDWCEDQWHCPACGDEWHDEQITETKEPQP